MLTPEKVENGQYKKAVAALFFATSLWGASFILIKVLDDFQAPMAVGLGVSGEFLTSAQLLLRYIFATVFLFPLLVFFRGLKFYRGEFVVGLGSGVFSAAGMLLQTDGLRFTTASVSAFLTQAYCVLLPLLELIFKKKLPSRKIIFCCFLLTLGILILSDISWSSFTLGRGEVETLLSALFFAGHIFWLDIKSDKKNDPLKTSFVYFLTLITITLLVSAFFWPKGVSLKSLSPLFLDYRAVFSIFSLGFFCTFSSFILMNTFQPRISSSVAGLIYSTEPLVAGILALFIPAWISGLWSLNYKNEILTNNLLWGGGLMLLANILMQIDFSVVLRKIGIKKQA